MYKFCNGVHCDSQQLRSAVSSLSGVYNVGESRSTIGKGLPCVTVLVPCKCSDESLVCGVMTLLRPLRWTMAIPLKEGLQIRCSFCGTAAEGRQFVEKAKSLGQIRELNEVDQQRQKQARVEGWFASLTEEGFGMC